jgi:uncharacterized repeat protein (TIGR03843 family)
VTATSAARLTSAPLEVVGRFIDASNATLLVRMLDRDPTPLDALAEQLGREPLIDDLPHDDLAVYKPRDGERPLWDFPEGTLHRREVAAHLVDVVMGAGLVPLTVLRDDAPFGPGSLQRFVPHDPEQHYFTLRDAALDGSDPELRLRLAMLAALDVVIDNADRKGGHVLVEAGDGPLAARIRAVDHGVTFNVEAKLRTVVWDLAATPLPAPVMGALQALEAALDEAMDGALGERLSELLDPAEVTATAVRVRTLRASGVLPEPIGPRPFPWPLL